MRRLGLRMTAAATTGPNNAPRPASSTPAMRVQPSLRAVARSRAVTGVLATAAGGLAAVLLALPTSLPLAAQTGMIHGRVVDSIGGPVQGAVVSVDGTMLRVTAGSSGAYQIHGLSAGTHEGVQAMLVFMVLYMIDVTGFFAWALLDRSSGELAGSPNFTSGTTF